MTNSLDCFQINWGIEFFVTFFSLKCNKNVLKYKIAKIDTGFWKDTNNILVDKISFYI